MSADTQDRLWHFALDIYGVEGVAAECLAVQKSHGADVCVLLTGAFAAAEGKLPDGAVLTRWDESVRDWRETVVRQIRAVRDDLKPLETDAEIAALRKAVLATELQAERLELKRLANAYLASGLPDYPQMERSVRIASTLAAAVSLYGDAPAPMPRLVEAATLWAR